MGANIGTLTSANVNEEIGTIMVSEMNNIRLILENIIKDTITMQINSNDKPKETVFNFLSDNTLHASIYDSIKLSIQSAIIDNKSFSSSIINLQGISILLNENNQNVELVNKKIIDTIESIVPQLITMTKENQVELIKTKLLESVNIPPIPTNINEKSYYFDILQEYVDNLKKTKSPKYLDNLDRLQKFSETCTMDGLFVSEIKNDYEWFINMFIICITAKFNMLIYKLGGLPQPQVINSPTNKNTHITQQNQSENFSDINNMLECDNILSFICIILILFLLYYVIKKNYK
jgi:hypothetical protein